MIIFLHGKESKAKTTSNGKAVLDYFTKESVIILDYKPLERTYEEIEKYIHEFVNTYAEENEGDPIIIIGISLGGYWAYKIASENKNVNKCVLLNPSLNYYPQEIVDDESLPLYIILNMDDELLDSAATANKFERRAYVKTFPTGGHRISNKAEVLKAIEYCISFNHD